LIVFHKFQKLTIHPSNVSVRWSYFKIAPNGSTVFQQWMGYLIVFQEVEYLVSQIFQRWMTFYIVFHKFTMRPFHFLSSTSMFYISYKWMRGVLIMHAYGNVFEETCLTSLANSTNAWPLDKRFTSLNNHCIY
jgi:hypothetical protein